MPYISQIQLPSDNQPYILKDKEAFGDASFSNSTLTLKKRDYDSTNSNTYLDIDLSSIIAANDAMVFKGTIGSGTPSTLPTTNYTIGDTYRVTVAGTYAGQACEIGDLIIAINDYVEGSASNNDWTVAQTNIDGAVTTSGGTEGYLVKFTDSHIIANGPQLGSSTTTYLNNAGNWATPTDEKLKIGTVTSGTSYYPIVATNSTGAATRQYDTNFIYKSTNGSSSATGTSILTLGNNASKTQASREGQIIIYGTGTVATTIKVKATSTARTINFPDASGDILVGTFDAGTTPTFSVESEILTITDGTAPSIS